MKNRPDIYRIILLAASLSLLALVLPACSKSSPAVKTTPPPATSPAGDIDSTPFTILSIVGGNVLVMKQGNTQWVKGEAGMTLETNAKIRTETGGKAQISFFEGSTIDLDGDTEISLAELSLAGAASKIKINQVIGNTVSRVKKLVDPASGFEIETTAAVVAVRGTVLGVAVDPSGVTVVDNIEGLISVKAQGVEVTLTAGTQTTVLPGETPGKPEPIVTPANGNTPTTPPPTSSTPSPTPSPSPTPTSPPTTAPVTAKMGIVVTCDRQSAFPGDTVTYQYRVGNEGDVSLSGITVTDDRAGSPTYLSGDSNANNILDVTEIWLFSVDYTIKNEEIGQLTNHATASGKGPGNQSAVASGAVTINITDIIVQITNLQNDTLVERNITVAGTVNDPSITQAVLTLNGANMNIAVVNGRFSSTLELAIGNNDIVVTVTKAGGITRHAAVSLVPDSGPQ
jgi:hypothetical protein